jgi:hypothetical protein
MPPGTARAARVDVERPGAPDRASGDPDAMGTRDDPGMQHPEHRCRTPSSVPGPVRRRPEEVHSD